MDDEKSVAVQEVGANWYRPITSKQKFTKERNNYEVSLEGSGFGAGVAEYLIDYRGGEYRPKISLSNDGYLCVYGKLEKPTFDKFSAGDVVGVKVDGKYVIWFKNGAEILRRCYAEDPVGDETSFHAVVSLLQHPDQASFRDPFYKE